MTEMRKFRNEVSSQVPPTSEIVKLAATIAAGKLINRETALAFANQAIELWEKSEEARNKKIDLLAMYARAKAKDDSLPKPKSYPVSLDEFLKLMMPARRVPDRMKFYREYLRQLIRVDHHMKNNPDGFHISIESTPVPSDEEIAKCIAKDRERQFDKWKYPNWASHFLRWYSQNENSIRRTRALAGATALKKKREQNG